MVCDEDFKDRILCIIETDKATVMDLANYLGGEVFGYTSVLLHIPASACFQCASRKNGYLMTAHRCDLCWSVE
ncbi:hypothetical protein B9N43_02480 [Denitratisoma sp. DHT3]|uniref:hypothetical protein n=1 Tax=Denitratisoma sp. DHT3 TaxID=1981880 RepID=UPI0011989989|nr:hypothetical protein [Denitratisoma sp. DHT3]QDX80226.1 hypothetical protein B9N43_02480 [Denitratisoma sp. DHT3]